VWGVAGGGGVVEERCRVGGEGGGGVGGGGGGVGSGEGAAGTQGTCRRESQEVGVKSMVQLMTSPTGTCKEGTCQVGEREDRTGVIRGEGESRVQAGVAGGKCTGDGGGCEASL